MSYAVVGAVALLLALVAARATGTGGRRLALPSLSQSGPTEPLGYDLLVQIETEGERERRLERLARMRAQIKAEATPISSVLPPVLVPHPAAELGRKPAETPRPNP